MFTERRTYTDFLNAEERMATNILAGRLERLQHTGLIRRDGEGRGAAFSLTEKGLDLLPAMLQLVGWAAKYDKRTAAPPEFVARINKDAQGLTAELRKSLRARYGLKRAG
jgi:DNA-binding HxlR family transcriptional regulator